MHSVYTNNGYIISIAHDSSGGVTDAEYQKIVAALGARPTAPDGYEYRLTTSLEWELYQLPEPTAEDEDAEATDADYLSALTEMGVNV